MAVIDELRRKIIRRETEPRQAALERHLKTTTELEQAYVETMDELVRSPSAELLRRIDDITTARLETMTNGSPRKNQLVIFDTRRIDLPPVRDHLELS